MNAGLTVLVLALSVPQQKGNWRVYITVYEVKKKAREQMLNGTDLSLYSFRDVVSRWATMCFIVRSSEAQKQSKKPNTANICSLWCSFDFGVNNSRTVGHSNYQERKSCD